MTEASISRSEVTIDLGQGRIRQSQTFTGKHLISS